MKIDYVVGKAISFENKLLSLNSEFSDIIKKSDLTQRLSLEAPKGLDLDESPYPGYRGSGRLDDQPVQK
jgi:hypothetical protein